LYAARIPSCSILSATDRHATPSFRALQVRTYYGYEVLRPVFKPSSPDVAEQQQLRPMVPSHSMTWWSMNATVLWGPVPCTG
jgi:hypothetical protein